MRPDQGERWARYTLGPVIITFTANPSLDRSAPLAGELRQGAVNRLGQVYRIAAGKGVNLSAAVWAAGHPTLAIVPVDNNDPLADALRSRGLPTRMVPVGRRARTNLSITHPDGTTTRFHEPGEPLTPENQTALVSAVLSSVPGASWLALCGSLPPGAPVDWYVKLAGLARSVGVKIAVDSNGPALDAVVAEGAAPPDLMSPNATELHQATGIPLRAALAAGDLGPAIEATLALRARGVGCVLSTLAEHGALLSCGDGLWHAEPDPVQPVSIVGAGDAALAGMLLAVGGGLDPEACVRRAVAYGTATVLKPGSEVSSPAEADAVGVTVRRLA